MGSFLIQLMSQRNLSFQGSKLLGRYKSEQEFSDEDKNTLFSNAPILTSCFPSIKPVETSRAKAQIQEALLNTLTTCNKNWSSFRS